MAPAISSGKTTLVAFITFTLMACDSDTISLGLPEIIDVPDTAGGTDDVLQIGEANESAIGAQNCPPLLGLRSVGPVAGLRDTTEVSNGLEDISFTQISENGDITLFDFQQDDVGNGDNCYLIDSGASVLEQISDSTFVNTFYDNPDVNCDVLTDTLELSFDADGTLEITSIDELDQDNDGDTDDTITETFPDVAGISTIDLIPCEF